MGIIVSIIINTKKNMDKIYETAGNYQEALNDYRAARQEKENKVYDNAIARVQALIR